MTSPFVAAGIAFLGIVVMAAILGTSASQMQFSVAASESASIQNDKVKETIEVILTRDGEIEIKNDWSKTSRIKEIRVVDDSGNVVLREPLDAEVSPFSVSSLDPQITTRISEMVDSLQ